MNGIEYIMIVVPIIILESFICACYGIRWMKARSIKPASLKSWAWTWLQLFGYTLLTGCSVFALIFAVLCLIYG